MRFIDEALIHVHGGHGGPGSVSFRREKYVPRGGPDGGDGGAGGDVLFIGDRQKSTLQDFRYKRIYKASNGQSGEGGMCAGSDGETIVIEVPVGTVFRDADTGEVLIDIQEDGQQWLACKGGRGGKGNSHFATATFQAPKFAQPGEEGEEKNLKMELKLLADVGLVGQPNAGKSTLISHISAARPKVADYPFTTLVPNLGVVTLFNDRHITVADIPGLIKGSHLGKGLGLRFLRHIERTQVLVHLLDGFKLLEEGTAPIIPGMPGMENPSDNVGDALLQSYLQVRRELAHYDPRLSKKPEIIAINKADILDDDLLLQATQSFARFWENPGNEKAYLPSQLLSPLPLVISGVSGQGIDEIKRLLTQWFQEQDQLAKGDSKKSNAVLLPDGQFHQPGLMRISEIEQSAQSTHKDSSQA